MREWLVSVVHEFTVPLTYVRVEMEWMQQNWQPANRRRKALAS